MLVLDATTKSITVAMSGAPATTNPDFVTAYSDDNGTTFVEGSSDGALNGTSQVTLVSAPGASTRRLIKTIYIENKDTATVTITVTLNNSSTLRNIAKVTLNVGDTWSTDGTFDTYGNLKQTIGTVNLSTGVTGVLPVANGGTGVTTSTGTGYVVLNNTPTLTTPVVTGYTETAPSITNSSTAVTLSLSSGTVLSYTLTGNCTFTMPTATSGTSFIVKLIQDGTGSRTATFTGVKWPGGTAPTITTTATTGLDILSFVCINSVWYGTFAQAFA
jgi:hypothetical protein